MTEQEAVRLSIEVWEWVSRNVPQTKRDWPGWDKDKPYVYKGKRIKAGCFLCQQRKDISKACEGCLLGSCDGWGDKKRTYFLYMEALYEEDKDAQRVHISDLLDELREGLVIEIKEPQSYPGDGKF